MRQFPAGTSGDGVWFDFLTVLFGPPASPTFPPASRSRMPAKPQLCLDRVFIRAVAWTYDGAREDRRRAKVPAGMTLMTIAARAEAVAPNSFRMDLTLLENRFHFWRHLQSRRQA